MLNPERRLPPATRVPEVTMRWYVWGGSLACLPLSVAAICPLSPPTRPFLRVEHGDAQPPPRAKKTRKAREKTKAATDEENRHRFQIESHFSPAANGIRSSWSACLFRRILTVPQGASLSATRSSDPDNRPRMEQRNARPAKVLRPPGCRSA